MTENKSAGYTAEEIFAMVNNPKPPTTTISHLPKNQRKTINASSNTHPLKMPRCQPNAGLNEEIARIEDSALRYSFNELQTMLASIGRGEPTNLMPHYSKELPMEAYKVTQADLDRSIIIGWYNLALVCAQTPLNDNMGTTKFGNRSTNYFYAFMGLAEKIIRVHMDNSAEHGPRLEQVTPKEMKEIDWESIVVFQTSPDSFLSLKGMMRQLTPYLINEINTKMVRTPAKCVREHEIYMDTLETAREPDGWAEEAQKLLILQQKLRESGVDIDDDPDPGQLTFCEDRWSTSKRHKRVRLWNDPVAVATFDDENKIIKKRHQLWKTIVLPMFNYEDKQMFDQERLLNTALGAGWDWILRRFHSFHKKYERTLRTYAAYKLMSMNSSSAVAAASSKAQQRPDPRIQMKKSSIVVR